jgi:hypothetical protein
MRHGRTSRSDKIIQPGGGLFVLICCVKIVSVKIVGVKIVSVVVEIVDLLVNFEIVFAGNFEIVSGVLQKN